MTLRVVSTSGAPTALGPYSQGIDTGSLVFVAGQVGREPATGEFPEGIEAQTETAMKNVAAILDAAGLSFADVAKTTVLLVDINDFDAVNAIYARFVSDPKPARATYAVAALPRGALVEIEAVAARS